MFDIADVPGLCMYMEVAVDDNKYNNKYQQQGQQQVQQQVQQQLQQQQQQPQPQPHPHPWRGEPENNRLRINVTHGVTTCVGMC
jgi:hypothetical protein